MNMQCFDAEAFYKWSKILFYLEARWGEATVAAWFAGAELMEFTEETLRVGVGNAFQCEVIERRCLHQIQAALKAFFHSDARVELYVRERDLPSGSVNGSCV